MFMFSKQRKADKQAASKPNREGKKAKTRLSWRAVVRNYLH